MRTECNRLTNQGTMCVVAPRIKIDIHRRLSRKRSDRKSMPTNGFPAYDSRILVCLLFFLFSVFPLFDFHRSWNCCYLIRVLTGSSPSGGPCSYFSISLSSSAMITIVIATMTTRGGRRRSRRRRRERWKQQFKSAGFPSSSDRQSAWDRLEIGALSLPVSFSLG